MSHFVTMIAAGVLAIAGASAMVRDRLADGRAAEVATQARQASGTVFTLRSNESGRSCTVDLGGVNRSGRAALTMDTACGGVMPGLENARYWVEQPDGTVEFTADGVDPIVTFAVADGVAYESLQPDLPLLSLAATD